MISLESIGEPAVPPGRVERQTGIICAVPSRASSRCTSETCITRCAVRLKAIPTRKETSRVPDLPLPLFWSIVQATPEFVRAAYVTMAALGLRVGEYLKLTKDHLLPHTLGVRIPGTKTAESAAVVRVDERLWPWIEAGVPSPLAYKWLREYFKRALKVAGAPLDLRLHDLRHCYAQWLVDAGASEARVQVGMRHATAAMTRRYAMQRDKGENAKLMANLLLPARTA